MNNLELQLVTFKQAKALKELDFPQRAVSSIGWYSTNGQLNNSSIDAPLDLLEGECYAPSLELVTKWLRDQKNIFFEILRNDKLSGYLLFYKYKKMLMHPTKKVFKTYEKALSAGIDKAIEILKQNETDNNN